MEDTKKQDRQQRGGVYDISVNVANACYLLDLAAEYIISRQGSGDPEDTLSAILVAVEMAREETRAAKLELCRYRPGQ